MRSRRILIAVAAACAAVSGCISLKILPPSLSGTTIEAMSICEGVAETGGLIQPRAVADKFGPRIKRLYCVVRLAPTSEALAIRWRWYTPDESLYRETGNLFINTDLQGFSAITASDILAIKSEAGLAPGKWRVAVYINDRFSGSTGFMIKEFDLKQ